MSPMDRLLAESEISRLIIRFAALNDAGDWAGVAALFAENARFTRPAGGDAIVGRAAIRASFESRPPRKSRHIISNILVDVASDHEAAAHSAMLLYTTAPGETAATSPALVGGFRDRLVHSAGAWLFAERVGFLDFKVEFK
jgi:3-phenylpropionate/cinnamic acid dioxygenase small subunit